jgi:hypothetical protein
MVENYGLLACLLDIEVDVDVRVDVDGRLEVRSLLEPEASSLEQA